MTATRMDRVVDMPREYTHICMNLGGGAWPVWRHRSIEPPFTLRTARKVPIEERGVKPVTIVMVTDMDRSLDWYRRLLPEALLVASSGYWSELSFGEASLALHITGAVEPGSRWQSP